MRLFRFLPLCLLGCALSASSVRAVEPPPQSPQQAVKVTAASRNSEVKLILRTSLNAQNDGAYDCVLWAQAAEKSPVRLWLARSATPDFAGSKWQEVALQKSQIDPSNGIYKLIYEASFAIGSSEQKYIAVRGEVEAQSRDVSQRFFSKTEVLPALPAWMRSSRDSARVIYATPSEKMSQMRFRIARSATRDFGDANWQTLPLAPKQPDGRSYETVVSTATPDEPWIAVYADGQLANSPLHLKSPTLIWNGLPFPKPASELRGNICPLHGTSDDVVPIIYGMAMSGGPPGAIYAGCIVGPGSATHHCNRCDREWGDFQAERETAKKENS